ncbi:hypothetical protein ACFQU7_34490 [Pseudoroseomonas wenyumeiae]
MVRVESQADRDRFVDLPFGLHAADPHWRPPIRSEIHDLISGKIAATRGSSTANSVYG